MVVDEIVSGAKSRNKIVWQYRLCNHRACKFDCTIDTSFLALIYKLARHVGKPVEQKACSPPSLTNWAFAEPPNKGETFWSMRGWFRQGSEAYSNYYTCSNPFEISCGSNETLAAFCVIPIILARLSQFPSNYSKRDMHRENMAWLLCGKPQVTATSGNAKLSSLEL